MRGSILTLAVVSMLLSGCMAMMTANKTWVQPGKGPADYERDMAQCRYEASIYGYTPHVRRYYRDWGDALADGIGQAIIIEARRAELTTACMQARGWQLMDTPTRTTQVTAHATATPPILDTPVTPPVPDTSATPYMPDASMPSPAASPAIYPFSEAQAVQLRPDTPGTILQKYYSEPVPPDRYRGSLPYEDYVANTERWKTQMRQRYGQW